MMQPMTETEKWRSSKVAGLYGRLVTIAGLRADILSSRKITPEGMVVGNLSPEEQARLDELDRERERVQAEIREVELEAARREREPVDPTPEIRRLSEELQREQTRRRWFAHQLFFRGMRAYRAELESIEQRISEIEREILWIEEAESMQREIEEKQEVSA
jgi:hypothetical protein